MDYPGEKLLLRLWETITEKGIGALLSPWQTRREGRSQIEIRREEILAIAQAEKDAESIRAGTVRFEFDKRMKPFLTNGDVESTPGQMLSSPVQPLIPFIERAQANALADCVRREVNIAKALIHAETELGNDAEEPPTEIVNDDWLFRWRESASQTSSADLQNIWGRLLAGEIKSPGSFSLRTLDFLKNISSTEAISISKLSRFIIDDMISRDAMDILESEGIIFQNILEMQQLGIIAGAEAIGLTKTYGSTQTESYIRPLLSNGRVILVRSPDVTKKLSIQIFQVTQIGQQILTLGKFEPHEPYLRKVSSIIKGQDFAVSIATYVKEEVDSIRIFNEEII